VARNGGKVKRRDTTHNQKTKACEGHRITRWGGDVSEGSKTLDLYGVMERRRGVSGHCKTLRPTGGKKKGGQRQVVSTSWNKEQTVNWTRGLTGV